MAVVSNTCNGSYGSDCKIYLEYVINSQSIANNQSNITLHLYAQATSSSVGAYNFNHNSKAYIYLNGSVKKSATNLDMDFRNKKRVDMLTWTGNVSHGSDGKLKITISGNFDTNGPSSVTTGSVSTSWTLTTIPRQAEITNAPNFNDEANPTVQYKNPAGSSASSLQMCITSSDESKTYASYRNISKTGSSYTFNLTDTERNALRNAIPNSNSLSVKFIIKTVLGGATYRHSSTKTMTIINASPTFSNFNYVDSNTMTTQLTGNSNKFIKKYSSVNISIPQEYKMQTKKGALPVSYNYIVGSQSKLISATTSTIPDTEFLNMNTNVINVYAIDSRKNQSFVSKSLETIDFKECSLQSLKAEREDGVGTFVKISILGTYDTINFGAVSNTIETVTLRCKEKTSTTWEEFNIKQLVTISDGKISCDNVRFLQKEFTLGTEYDIQVEITDKLSTDYEVNAINSGKVLMSALKNEGVCFGGIYDKAIGGPLQITGGFPWSEKFPYSAAKNKSDSGMKELPKGKDTKEYWSSLQNGWYWYENTNAVPNLPASYGFVEKIGFEGGDYTVYFHKQSSGTVFRKTGDESNNNPWTSFRSLNVGDVIMTSTNTNPSATHGGTWQLIDKEFALFATEDTSSLYTINNTNTNSASVVILRQGHEIMLRINFYNKVEIGDGELEFMTFKKEAFGSNNDNIFYGRDIVGLSDGGNGLINMTITADKVLKSSDVVTKTSGGKIGRNQSCWVMINWLMPYDRMDDSACDKFYWKKIA